MNVFKGYMYDIGLCGGAPLPDRGRRTLITPDLHGIPVVVAAGGRLAARWSLRAATVKGQTSMQNKAEGTPVAGGTQRVRKYRVTRGCVKCGWCVNECRYHAITLDKTGATIDPARCVGCGQCYDNCASEAIEAYFEEMQ